MTDPTLYETDFVAWALEQAGALRRLRDHPSDPVASDLDLENLIEEMETLARRDVHELEDQLRSALSRLIRAAFDPDEERARQPRSEVIGYLRQARILNSPTGLRLVDEERVWAEAREEAGLDLPCGVRLNGLPDRCPIPFGTLVSRPFDISAAITALRGLMIRR